MCHACFTVLCSYHEFRKICRETEEKINNGQYVNVVTCQQGYQVFIKQENGEGGALVPVEDSNSETETVIIDSGSHLPQIDLQVSDESVVKIVSEIAPTTLKQTKGASINRK